MPGYIASRRVLKRARRDSSVSLTNGVEGYSTKRFNSWFRVIDYHSNFQSAFTGMLYLEAGINGCYFALTKMLYIVLVYVCMN